MESRDCPQCGKEITYTLRGNYLKALKAGKCCKGCAVVNRRSYAGEANPFFGKKHTEATMKEFKCRVHKHVKEEWFRRLKSEQWLGSNNPTHGRSTYEIWLAKYGKDKADELEANRRNKLSIALAGKNNPMFGKPSPRGSGNGWSGWYKGWFFRSIRELSYVVNVLEASGGPWRTGETKDLRIPYTDWNGVNRTYAADFLVNEVDLVEIKPVRLMSSRSVKLKQGAAETFCRTRGYNYLLVDSPPLSTDVIAILVGSGLVTFTDRYKKMFSERYGHGKA